MSTRSRFFIDRKNVGGSTVTVDRSGDVHHIKNVLRLTEGDEIEVSDSDSWEYACRICSITEDSVEAEILDKQKFAAEPAIRVTLFQGIPKAGKMDDIVQRTAELGVAAVVPVFMDRTVVRDNGKYSRKIQRMRIIAESAAKQCKRGTVPVIEESISFAEMIVRLMQNSEADGGFDMLLFPYEDEKNTTIKTVLRDMTGAAADSTGAGCEEKKGHKKIAVVIGPEGGFSDSEAEQIKEAGAAAVSLGKTTLRTETAGIVALAMIMYELEL